jgi:hypothetical protein
VINKACHPESTHGIGYKNRYWSRKPLASRSEKIPGIPLVEAGRNLKDAEGLLEAEIEEAIGRERALYTGVHRA